MNIKRIFEKFENLMVAVTFAEADLREEAVRYVKADEPAHAPIPALKGVNIWFGVVIIED
ncbi:MAG: hypothetical protein OEZ31_07425 [Nitrospirota bacterium]|nr:hypothetical protein [Nitrospirota bacterium]MDH5768769.1 hypothetical protein [Nitrospirota bacterium]